MATTGIKQWSPGEVPLSLIQAQTARGEWHVVHNDAAQVRAALRVLWADPEFWGPDDGRAVYVHGLMVDAEETGQGWGAALLDWAGAWGLRRGRPLLRLDSSLANGKLTTYYEDQGFERRGTIKLVGLQEVILWEPPRPDQPLSDQRPLHVKRSAGEGRP